MPRKRRMRYYRCGCCGALVPFQYECECPAAQLIAHIKAVFPGTTEEPNNNGNSSNHARAKSA